MEQVDADKNEVDLGPLAAEIQRMAATIGELALLLGERGDVDPATVKATQATCERVGRSLDRIAS